MFVINKIEIKIHSNGWAGKNVSNHSLWEGTQVHMAKN